MSDRPQDQGGQDGAPYSLSKGGDGAANPSYGYGPPSYGGQPEGTDQPTGGAEPGTDGRPGPGTQPGYEDQQSYGSPVYSDQSTPYGQPGGGYAPPLPGEQPVAPVHDPQGGYVAPGGEPGYGAYAAPVAPGAYGGGPGGPGGPYGVGQPPPRKKRTGLVIGIIAGALVVVVGLAIGLVALVSDGGGKPSEKVQAYLEALAAGDAPKALNQAAKAPDTTFATSEALKAQQKVAGISSIEVSSGSRSGNRARVTATYKFGEKQADETYTLTKIDGDWKIDDALYPIDLSDLDVPGLTLLGIDTAGKDKAYVFPGPLVWGSTNEYLSVKERDSDEFTLSPADGSYAYSTLETGLSDAGEKAVATAVSTFIAACAKAKDLNPDNCPQSEYDYQAVAGTATWTAPTDLSALEYRTSSPVTKVYVTGDLTWSVSYTAEDYSGARKKVTSNDVDGSLYGTVDLTKSPPVYTE